MSELRRNAGLSAFEVGIFDRLTTLNLEGRLPMETVCAECQVPTKEYLGCSVECERTFAKGPGFWKTFFVMLLSPLGAQISLQRDFDNPDVHGRELVVKTPIRLCRTCFLSQAMSRKRCVNLLRKSEYYRVLLDNYPDAEPQWEKLVSD